MFKKINKKLGKRLYAIIAAVFVLEIVAISVGFGFFSKADNEQNAEDKNYSDVKRGTSISIDSSGVLQINRRQKDDVPMGKENTWTLFVYMTGSNLESKYGNATSDIEEILKSNINEQNIQNVNVIIQTGGSSMWHSNNISNQHIQRYKVDASNKGLTLVKELNNSSMGDVNTLYDFLDWGVTNYPAEHMGVVFWNHGSGVESGLCNDEIYGNDSISVHELEYAFAKLDEKITSKFEMIGFDACLSGSLEYANLLAPYAKYMVASAEVEIGDGWYYTPIIDYLLDNSDCTGAELGKIICDNYALYIDDTYQGERKVEYTLATYDLSKVDEVCVETNNFAKYFYDIIKENPEKYWRQEGFRENCLAYNKCNLDIGSIFERLDINSSYDYNTTSYRKALEEMIVYSSICDQYKAKGAKGITLYLPSKVIYVDKLNTYRNVCFSPYWLKYIEWMNTRAITENMSKYRENKWESSEFFFEKDFGFIVYDELGISGVDAYEKIKNILNRNLDYKDDGFPENWFHNITYGVTSYQGISGLQPPYEIMRNLKVNVDGDKFSSVVDNNKIKAIDSVYNTVFANVNDTVVCLGDNNKVNYNNETGEIVSEFDGEWWMLPDGQLLTSYVISKEDNVTVYAFPVDIDSNESSIRIKETIDNNGKASYETLGVWDTSSNSINGDNFSRSYLPIKAGMKITPIYDVFDFGTGKYETEYGEEYVIGKEFVYYLTTLDDGEYLFAYSLDLLNKQLAFSELTKFTMKDKVIEVVK